MGATKQQLKEQLLNDCVNWGENRADEYYLDVGCVLGHCYCNPEKCKDYSKHKER